MRHPLRPFLVACLAVLALPLAAHAASDVKVSLSAHRVLSNAAGKEFLAPADHAKPGEIIEYQARYTNTGAHGVRQLVATLPIPAGVQYLASTAQPVNALASVDGEHYAPIPLQRRVRMPDGTDQVRDVPCGEYRFLRWTLGDMAAGHAETVRARVRVEATGGPMASATSTGTTTTH